MTATTTYHTVTKILHWLTALLILALIPLGVVANRLPYDTADQLLWKAQVFSVHKTLGVLVFFVALARIGWAVTQTKPGPLHPDRKAETLAAEVVHWVLYVSLVAVPLTGWIEHAATSGFAPIWWPFGQTLPLVPTDEGLAHVFAGLHWLFGKLMMGALLLHVAGALKHHLIDRDVTLRRMWFGGGRMPAVGPHRPLRLAPVVALALFPAAAGVLAATGFFAPAHDTADGPVLTEVASDWQVQSGSIGIGITQLGSPVTGSFADWTAAISFDPGTTGEMGAVDVTIGIGSLTLGSVTGQAMGADYFDAAQFPTARFQAVITAATTGYLATGTLTLKGAEVPVALPFTLDINGPTASMTGQTVLNRTDFGIGASGDSPATLAHEVTVDIALTATRP